MRYIALALAACFLLTPLEAAARPADRANTLVVKAKRSKVSKRRAARRASRPRHRTN
jgi:hypothetical protein